MFGQKQQNKRGPSGFTLIEAVVGTAIFAILVTGILGVFSSLARVAKVNRQQTILTTLADDYLEIIRNLPYSQVGTLNGNPNGSLPDFTNAKSVTLENQPYKIYYEVTYVDDPADGTLLAGTDSTPNDYKQVKMFIQNVTTGAVTTFLTNVSPKGLEGLNNAGALYVTVYNSQGLPVPNASVHIENHNLVPNIILDRKTDANGTWTEVGLPDNVNGYHIVVTKTGDSTDQTYPITQQNPNPTKPDATIANGQVTQVSFFIDLLSNLNIYTLNQTCQNLNNVGVNVQGAKLIGTSPNIYKFNQNFNSTNGLMALNSIEWDTYTPTLLSGQNYTVYGTSPIQTLNLLPAANQNFTLILGPPTANSLLVVVKDSGTGNPLEGATVHLQQTGGNPQDYYKTTGGSIWSQNNWTGGPGQVAFTDTTRYLSDDGNIDVNTVPTGVRLRQAGGHYANSGQLFSSAFDTGAASTNYSTITWLPTSQNPATALQFQIATNNDDQTWNYLGPDGTANTYYTVPGTTINQIHNGNRYIRYRALLTTTDNTQTPVITSLGINYVSGCFTPGQAIFTNLTAGNNYNLSVSLTGYQTATTNNLNINGNQILQVLLSP